LTLTADQNLSESWILSAKLY